MARHGRTAGLLLATLVALLAGGWGASTSSAATPPVAPKGFFGVLGDGPLVTPTGFLPGETTAMRAAGVGSVRLTVPWSTMEPTAGAFDLSSFDLLVLQAAARRLGVLPVVLRTPVWARLDPSNDGSPPADPALLQPFLRALVARYGANGTLWTEHPEVPKLAIRRWQVWNEPDTHLYWSTPKWPAAYTALLRSSFQTLHAADPGAEVLAAGLTNRSWLHLRQLLNAGAGPYMDAAAVHPFSGSVANIIKIIRLFRDGLDDHGLRRTPILVGELTWSSALGNPNYPKPCRSGWDSDERGQAERVASILRAVAAERRRLDLDGAFWSTWLSPPAGGLNCFDYNGLRKVGASGTVVAKPALAAFRRTVRATTR